MTDAKTTHAAPKDAATLIVLRDGVAGLEVFMTRRAPTMAFAPNAMVFPGGKVDSEDYFDTDKHPLRPFQNAVLREAFEEVGLLLAKARDGQAITPRQWLHLSTQRENVAQRTHIFDAVLKHVGLVPDYHALTYVSRWITPLRFPKRFDTRFFIAQMPEGQHLAHDGSEAVHSEWVAPLDLLARFEAGQEFIFPPTFWMLKDVSLYGCVRSAIDGMAIEHFEADLRNKQA